nr:MAG TPA: hypothetical protein [Caudoviricetes sp.]
MWQRYTNKTIINLNSYIKYLVLTFLNYIILLSTYLIYSLSSYNAIRKCRKH